MKRNALALLGALLMIPFLPSHAEPLDIGDQAPRLSVRLDDGTTANLGDFYDRGKTFLFFYPKANTPGCTAQACSLRDNYQAVVDAGVQVIGVSADGADAQAKFRAKQSLPFPLVADNTRAVIDAFGVPTRLGMASRQAFLVVDGAIAWRDLSASTKKQAEDLLAALTDLP